MPVMGSSSRLVTTLVFRSYEEKYQTPGLTLLKQKSLSASWACV